MGTIYITVHGTGDGEREPTVGEPPADIQWWRPESPFCQELLAAALEGSTIEPFAWSGANEEADRRAAAERLLKRCVAAEKAGEQLHLIGHSHGGSVIATALRYAAAERRKLPAMVAFTTVGTPFLKLRQKLMPWDRYDAVGRATLAFALIGLFFVCGAFFEFLQGETGLFASIFLVGGATLAIGGILALYRLGRSRRGVHARRLLRRFDAYFATRWVGVSSIGDEAIGGLTQLSVIRANLFQRDLLSPFLSLTVQLAFLAFVAAFWLLPLEYDAAGTPFENDSFFAEKNAFMYHALGPLLHWFVYAHAFTVEASRSFFFGGGFPDIGLPEMFWTVVIPAGFTLSLVAAYFAALIVLMKGAEWFSEYVIGAPIAALLNGAVRGAVVSVGYGAAKVRESPNGVASSPFLEGPQVEPLPEEIDSNVLTYARDSLAATFLASHHELFRVDPGSKEGVSMAQAVMRHVSWSELVHTAYFRVPDCRAHLVSRIAGSERVDAAG